MLIDWEMSGESKIQQKLTADICICPLMQLNVGTVLNTYGMHVYYMSNEFINGGPRAPDMHDSEITIMVGQIFI